MVLLYTLCSPCSPSTACSLMLVPVCAFIAACSLYYAARKAYILRLTSLNVRWLTRHMFVFIHREIFSAKTSVITRKSLVICKSSIFSYMHATVPRTFINRKSRSRLNGSCIRNRACDTLVRTQLKL